MAERLSSLLFLVVKDRYLYFTECQLSRLVVDEEGLLSSVDFKSQDGDYQQVKLVCTCAPNWLSHQSAFRTFKYLRVKMNPRVFCLLLKELSRSRNFRRNVISNVLKARSVTDSPLSFPCPDSDAVHVIVRIMLKTMNGDQDGLDTSWGNRLEALIQERIELDETMACLSTLGGAFSSLGDEYTHHAETAGRISLRQMRIALKLGDPVLVSKCKLFLALSWMQRGKLKLPKIIILEQYNFARSLPENSRDTRLEKMCKGAWAKLQYIHRQKRCRRAIDEKARDT